MRVRALSVVIAAAVAIGIAPDALAQKKHKNVIIDLWTQGKATFGVYVPAEGQPLPSEPPPPPNQPRSGGGGRGQQPGGGRGAAPRYTKQIGEALAKNPLYDFAFLNLEGAYSVDSVKAIVEGLRSPSAVNYKMLIVRIPPISDAGADVTKARVKEILALGADGVTIPHVRNLNEAKLALSFFKDAKANVWSPSNRNGEHVAMIMLEDPEAIEQARQIGDLKNYSILACGIGSLGGAIREKNPSMTQEQAAAGAEAGTQKVLAETKRTKTANMLTANASNVERRVREGFLALLMSGAGSDETIKIGRKAAGR